MDPLISTKNTRTSPFYFSKWLYACEFAFTTTNDQFDTVCGEFSVFKWQGCISACVMPLFYFARHQNQTTMISESSPIPLIFFTIRLGFIHFVPGRWGNICSPEDLT